MSSITATIHDTAHGFEIWVHHHGRQIDRLTIFESEKLLLDLRSVITQARGMQQARQRIKTLPMR